MASIQYQQNQTIVTEGQSLSNLYLILKGSVQVSFPGGSYTLSKGDVIGICEIASDVHLFRYTALEDTIVAGYSYIGFDTLDDLFQANKDLTGLFSLSIIKQINTLFQKYNLMVFEYGTFYHSCKDVYATYEALCNKHMVAARTLPSLEEFQPLDDAHSIESWLVSYYSGLHQFITGGAVSKFSQSASVALGLVIKASLDALTIASACRDLDEYRNTYYQIYLDENEEDLFSLYTSLYFKINPEHPDRATLYSRIHHMIDELESYPNAEYASKCIHEFNTKSESLGGIATSAEDSDSTTSNVTFLSHLSGSLDTILNYSGVDKDFAIAFKESISAYKEIKDPASTDGPVALLRKKITEAFYTLYETIFLKSLSGGDIPVPVKLFLYFGYVDEELAGSQNLAALYTLADSMEENLVPGVYTLYHWLKAIYRGEKEPSRNQYDEDYTDHVLALKGSKKISESEAKELLGDQNKKVLYELKNMFPSVNKVTCGRISTYCPIFAEHQVMKNLSSCYVTPASILQIINDIRALDFSAFYREVLYNNDKIGVPKEFIHVEYLPDFILMPNIGTRGVMWQEIEGKKRTTPARMMLSVFQLEDLNHILVRLTGEYRWEMCKRVQGARWNDVSERSLTSEYFDYVQFYRKNHDLSVDAKEKIKTSLQKARNNFKEMFIMDYMIWILYEGSGSPRLNKVARQILFTYCPFHSKTRQNLAGNPIYKELSDRYDVQLKRRSHHIEMLLQKIRNSGHTIPEELENENNYILM